LTSLNLSANQLGQPVVPEGWSHGYHGTYHGDYSEQDGGAFWEHTDGRRQNENPGKAEGIIAIANAIKDMGALTSLDISSQADQYGRGGIGAEGATHLAGALKDHA
jgi:hypothetical protein